MNTIDGLNNNVFKDVYVESDINNLNDGDYYYDTRNDNYYIYYRTGSIQIISYSGTSNAIASSYNTYTLSSNSISLNSTIHYDKTSLKKYLKENPDLLDEIICELRKEKIDKIRNK